MSAPLARCTLLTAQSLITGIDLLASPATPQLQLKVLSASFAGDGRQLLNPASGSYPPFFAVARGPALFLGIAGVQDLAQGTQVALGSVNLVHRGPWGANSLYVSAAEHFLDVLTSSGLLPTSDLVIGGHSYGGATAQVLSVLAQSNSLCARSHCITFGAPRPGDAAFARAMGQVATLRFMNAEDPVPRFPPSSTEAATFYGIAPLLQLSVLSSYTQTPGGLVLYQTGKLKEAQLPPQALPITDLSLLNWATGLNGFGNPAHSSRIYRHRLLLVPALLEEDTPLSVARLLSAVSGDPVAPAGEVGLSPSLDTSSGLASGGVSMSVLIPLANRPSVVKVTSKVYRVQWGSHIIATGMTRTNAKAFRKALFKALRVLQTEKDVDIAAFGSGLSVYLAAATNPAGGFVPILGTM